MIEKVKPSATVTESPSDLQTFQKRLILHVLVMDNYTLVNRRTNRLEFSGALTEANIATVVAAIEDELKSHFLFACHDVDVHINDLFSLPDKEGNLMIFEMNDQDYWVDYNIESAIVNYIKFQREVAGLDDEELEINAHALTKEEANRFKFHDADERISRTFAEQLKVEIEKGEKFPNIFATHLF